MPFIHFNDGDRIRSYSATTTGTKSVVTVKIETSEHYALAHLLRDLAEAQAALATRAKPEPKTKARQAAEIEHRPMLALPFIREAE